MSKYFAKFPTITYQMGKSIVQLTNLLFRVKVLNDVKHNIFSYVDYKVPEGDTIEITAEKYYGDPESHWMIILANDFVDPLYDWPLTYNELNQYVVNKYGSIATAQTSVHHYEKIKTYRSGQPPVDNVITTIISKADFDATPTYSYVAWNLSDGITTVQEITTTASIDCYTYETITNEAKRNIKLIKADYYSQITSEFQNLVSTPPLFRKSLQGFSN